MYGAYKKRVNKHIDVYQQSKIHKIVRKTLGRAMIVWYFNVTSRISNQNLIEHIFVDTM